MYRMENTYVRKINQTIPQIEKTCRECHQSFTARYSFQKKCQGCVHEQTLKKKAQERAKDKTLIAQREAKLKENQKFLNNPDLIFGYDALSDYLNIGVEEIRRHWTTIPAHSAMKLINKNNKLIARKVIFFSREEVNRWAKETGYWKLKETTVKNYKEPLKPVLKKDGFGYYGAVTTTKDHNGIQCHICGKFFMHLSGHIWQIHKLKTRTYKEKFELAYSTPLTADNYREELKQKELDRIKNMTPEQREAYVQRRKEFARRAPRKPHGLKSTLETKNKRGVCPDQLIDQIRQCSEELERVPSKREFISWCKTQKYIHKIYDTFGSYKKAVEIAGLEPRKSITPKGKQRAYDEEELLEYLKIFYEQTGKSPTQTDWYSYDLPRYSTYISHFGSIRNARELAEVPHPTGRWGEVPKQKYRLPFHVGN